MLAARMTLPAAPAGHPPIILVHGAANDASIWRFWQQALAEAGWASYALDLRGHGHSDRIDLSSTSMEDYAADVRTLMAQLPATPVLLGWSLGGLVALMVAVGGGVRACIALAPSMPARNRDTSVPIRTGEFGPEEYGLTRDGVINERAMPDLDPEEQAVAIASLGNDSRYARDERRAGIVIEALPAPLLIATGTEDRQWPLSRYDNLWLPADYVSVEGTSHWGLVLNRRALTTLIPAVLDWLAGIGLLPGEGEKGSPSSP